MTLGQVRKLLKARAKPCAINRGSSGLTAWCAANGVSKARASEFLQGKRLPTTDILDALNLEWRVMPKRGSQ